MESGVGNHYGSGKSGGGNGGLFCDTCELGAPWGAPHHGPLHQLPSPFFHLNNPAADSIPFSSATSLPFSPHHHNLHTIAQAGDAHHLTCLKLGKRQYYEEGRASDPPAASGGLKRERVATAVPRGSSSAAAAATASPPSSSSAMVVPRCQVEGCNLALVDAKDYHRRHKVCEIHSKAPKVVVLGIEQRFCQQCSRFHVISEFDDSKRSCRRRLAGHNERRRKSSAESVIRNPSPLDGTAVGSGMPYLSPSNAAGHALSLLSPKASSSWASSDLSSQSSAALRELIAENRAAILAGQLLLDRGTWHGASPGAQVVFSIAPQQQQQQPLPLTLPPQLEDGWDHLRTPGAQVTLDLMQTPSSSIEILSGRSRSKEGDEECCDIWKSLEGTHVV